MKKYVIGTVQEKFGQNSFHSVSSKIAGVKVKEYIQNAEKPAVVFVK
jgi:hypothetical protein